MCVSGLWKEAGEPGENMQTPDRKALLAESSARALVIVGVCLFLNTPFITKLPKLSSEQISSLSQGTHGLAIRASTTTHEVQPLSRLPV